MFSLQQSMQVIFNDVTQIGFTALLTVYHIWRVCSESLLFIVICESNISKNLPRIGLRLHNIQKFVKVIYFKVICEMHLY